MVENICTYCNIGFIKPKRRGKKGNAKPFCSRKCLCLYNNRERFGEKLAIDWDQIQKDYDAGCSQRDLLKKYRLSTDLFRQAREEGKFKPRTTSESGKLAVKTGRKDCGKCWTEERRKKQSERKIQLYKNHPEKHPNRKLANNRAKISYPEQLAYCYFKENNIKFEHQVQIGKYFADFVVDKLVIEIDGSQWHQDIEREKTRDEFILNEGYKIVHIPASNVLENLNNLFETTIVDIDISKFEIIHKPKKEYFCKCGKEIARQSTNCRSCDSKSPNRIRQVKFSIEKEELEKLIDEMPMEKIGEMFGVSGKAIKKRCDKFGIITKTRGDWAKINSENLSGC